MIPPTLDLDGAASNLWDVAILGAGPAGALAARRIAAHGARVLLVDRKPFPRPKVCGACLNGKALSVLDSVGLSDRIHHLGGLNLNQFHVRLSGRQARFPLPTGLALSRDRLDSALIQEAVASGAHFLPETTASLESASDETRTLKLTSRTHTLSALARVVVIASGLAGVDLGSEPGLTTRASPRSRVGAGCTVETFPDSYEQGTIHMAVGGSGYVGLVRVENGLLNVASAFDRPFLRASGSPSEAATAILHQSGFPPLPSLSEARWLGTVTLTRRTRPVASHRLFLIGDAAGYVEPFTGEGMGAALTSALAVAPLALQGATDWHPSLIHAWSSRYHRLVGRGQILCRGLTFASRNPWIARAVFGLSAGSPKVSRSIIQLLNKPPLTFEAT